MKLMGRVVLLIAFAVLAAPVYTQQAPRVTVQWTYTPAPHVPVTFQIQRCEGTATCVPVDVEGAVTTTHTYIDTAIVHGTLYCYTVVAHTTAHGWESSDASDKGCGGSLGKLPSATSVTLTFR